MAAEVYPAAQDAFRLGVVHEIVHESKIGARKNDKDFYPLVKDAIIEGLNRVKTSVSPFYIPDPKLKRTFLSVAFRHGRNPGKVAAARQLLDLIYHMLRKKEDYRSPRTLASTVV